MMSRKKSIVAIIIMLISCKFKFGVLVIGSGSMTGTINKGDIVLYETYGKNDELKNGDIIVFIKDDLKIVHRIVDQRILGEETRYYTKQTNKELYKYKGDTSGSEYISKPSIPMHETIAHKC